LFLIMLRSFIPSPVLMIAGFGEESSYLVIIEKNQPFVVGNATSNS